MRRRTLLGLGLVAALALPTRRRRAGSPAAAPHAPAPSAVPAASLAQAPAPPRPTGLREAADVLVTAVRTALKGNVTDVAASLAYYAFLAIPAILLVAVGAFGVLAGPDTIQSLLDRLDGVVPADALSLIHDTLTRVTERAGSGAGLAAVGLVLALWTASGAMAALMRGLNRIHGVEETRSFAKQRGTAVALIAWSLLALAVSFGLLVLGAPLSHAVGDALDARTLVGWLWWVAQWPILAGALFVATAGILRMGPAARRRSTRAASAGAAVAVVIWIAASGLFGVYVSGFSSYGAAWGSLSAVIVMLVWLWLTSVALLLGAQVEAEVEARSR